MANFQPFKSYILFVMDEWIQKYNIQGPFLDAGCGIGDVSLHLAIKGWQGDAIDISTQSLKIAQTLLQPYPEISVEQKSIDFDPSKKFNFILLLDVLEHLPDDKSVLMAAARMGFTNAYTMITVPSNPDREWRWDDEVYGHLRRYKPNEIEDIICSSGFEVIEMWEISYPLFWFLRRLYTLILSQPTLSGNSMQRTQQSPFTEPWKIGWITDVISNPNYWKPLFRFQNKYRDRIKNGNELAILARKN